MELVTRRGMGRYVTNEGRKLWSSEKRWRKITSFFIDGMDNLGFSEEEILTFFVLT